jgi:hypothetical protein
MLYPQRYGEPKQTKPVGMPCGLKPGGSVGQSLVSACWSAAGPSPQIQAEGPRSGRFAPIGSLG